MDEWECERVGEWVIRSKWTRNRVPRAYLAEARRGEFKTDSALTEPAGDDVWFAFGSTREEAVANVKREIFQ